MTQEKPGKPARPKSAASLLVGIANELYTFHRTADTRSPDGEVISEGSAYVRPKQAGDNVTLQLEDIRPNIAAVYEAEHGHAAAVAALGNAMTVLLGKARQARPDAPTAKEQVAGLLGAPGAGPIPADRGLEIVTSRDDCPLPEGYVIPEPYVVAPDGIHLVKHDGTGHARVTWAWLFPVRVYIDPAGDQLVELAWRDGRRWVSRLIRRAITKSGRKLVTEAGDAGLPVIEAEARQAERWLAAAEAANHEAIARHPVARQLGWQADGRTFVTGQDSPWRVEPSYSDQAGALAAHRPQGTLASWQQVIGDLGPYVVVRLGLYAGLAAPLLVPLELDSFTIDFSGKSTRGKTITAQVGLSCWADPSERSDGLFSWKTKIIGVEKRLNLVCGLPVVVDETRVVTSPELVDSVIYQIPKNHGQARGGGWPNMIPWRAIVISTGEQAATSFTSHQGASARVLSVQSPPFGTEGADSRAAAESVRTGVETNYGTAGPAFTARLQAALAEAGGPEKLRTRHEELTELLRGGTDMTGRRAPLVACLALAAQLAAEWQIVPYQAPDASEWPALFTSAEQRDNRPEMALDIVREYLASHDDSMWSPMTTERSPATGWIGHEAAEGPALLPEKVRAELRRCGYEMEAVVPGWLEMGALVTKENQRPPYLVNRSTAGRQSRHLVFKREVLSGQDE